MAVLASLVVFLISALVPGDPVLAQLGDIAASNPATVLETRAKWGLDLPLWERYGVFLNGLVHGDLGVSIATRRPVLEDIVQYAPATLELATVSFLLTLLVGIPLGIWAGVSRRVERVLTPVLDFMQTMPTFVSLAPLTLVFLIGPASATIATMIYAVPPVIRLVEAGLRSVPETIVEAATAAGATERQILFKVRLPVSAQALLLAANQGIVMVLALVVVGGLVGAGALGYDVIAGLAQSEDFGKGFAAAVSIVLLGVMLDRITQGAGARRPRLKAAG
jgi:glycine betaine/proline transport system permease protein